MGPNVNVSLPAVKRALSIHEFDFQWAQRQMAPRPRAMQRALSKPGNPRLGGVLLLLYPFQAHLNFVLTRRTDTLESHQGQISLPGGSREDGEELTQTALRETDEELGGCQNHCGVLGRLAPLYIPPSDFEIHPFVAYTDRRPDFQPSPVEVAELLEVPLSCLLDPAVHRQEEWVIRGISVDVPFYLIQGHKVWGATAMVLSELEQRLRVVLREDGL